MSRSSKSQSRAQSSLIEVKSKFDAEFRRFSVERDKYERLEDFRTLVEELHRLQSTSFVLAYTDPRDGDLLPITNDDNFRKALQCSRPLLRVIIQHKGKTDMEVLSLKGIMWTGSVYPVVCSSI
ncbi:partitioning defective protein 6-like [Penaeus monodon]|uniref:partitioning defective protein 6-like n=1 Tax=Penaeus monodon TaxID=6687 RepID=UPI0018A74D5D|nr:partitioning defective protein 6-like [Penaeus monodon]